MLSIDPLKNKKLFMKATNAIFLLVLLLCQACNNSTPDNSDMQAENTTNKNTIRIGIASFAMETCTFCPRKTDIEHFEYYGQPFTGEEVLQRSPGFVQAANEYQDVELFGVYSVREPLGGSMGSWVTEQAFDKYSNEIVNRLANIDGLDAVFLPLHGAMAVTGIDRPEAELVRRIKAKLGDIPIAVTLDLHANVDQELAKYADIILIVKRFPHYDFDLMGERAARLLVRTVRGDYTPTLASRRPNIAFATVFGGTHQGLPQEMMERARRWENRHLNTYVSVAMGFPFVDVVDMGMSIFVQTNGDKALADKIADDMNSFIYQRRQQFEYDIPKLKQGVMQGLSYVDSGQKPVVLANMSDRLGDATHILDQLIQQQRSNFVVATISDQEAIAQIKSSAAIGDKIRIKVGGHTSTLAGNPVTLEATIAYLGKYDIGGAAPSDLVTLTFGQNNWLLLTPTRYQVTTRKILDHAGVPVEQMDIFVVKSRNHFRRGFMETGLAKQAVVIDAPGHGPADIGQLNYLHIPKATYSRFFNRVNNNLSRSAVHF